VFLFFRKEKKPAPPPAASRGNAKPIMTGPGSGLTTEVMRKILCDEAAGHVNKHDYHKAIKDYDVVSRSVFSWGISNDNEVITYSTYLSVRILN
jgi:hypothetical protein